MATFAITCDSPLHATRVGQPDFSDNLGTSDRQTHGYKCGACARLDPPSPEQTAAINADTIRARAQAALAVNAGFLANASPSNADVLAQVRVLTRECNAVIRLLLDHTDDTTGT